MAIREMFFHIKGTPDKTTQDSRARNYISASLIYDKGHGYLWYIHRVGRYTWSDQYGDRVMQSYTIGDLAPSIYEYILPCTRAGKAREREAIELFDGSVVSAIIHRLGYEIEIDEVES